jgi:Uma2 family endonuclease
MSEDVIVPGLAMTFAEAAQLDVETRGGEVVGGRWEPVTRSTYRHGEIAAGLTALLWVWARKTGSWRVSSGDPGTRLAHDPDTLRGPDIAVVRSERFPAGRGVEGWLEGAPEVAVEIAGAAQSAAELTRKALEYLRAGARMVWVLDADVREVLVFTPPDHVLVLGPEETLSGGDVLPGFEAPVAVLFE